MQGEGLHPDTTELKDLTNTCLDSLGYVIFSGVITNRRDEKGNNIIDFNYRRYNFSKDDVLLAIEQLKKFYEGDNG